jgi:hypothetical protein
MRAAEVLAKPRMIVLLRDPAERAYSHWRHNTNLGLETATFEEALELEQDRTRRAAQRLAADPLHKAGYLMRFSYAARGRYVEQLERWMRSFPRDQFLILPSEGLFAEPEEALERICGFLGIPVVELRFGNFSRANPAPGDSRPAAAIEQLRADLAPANRGLAGLMDVRPSW